MNRTKTIWKTVVFAGAMLGSAGCHKAKPAPTTPPATVNNEGGDDAAKPDDATQTDPSATATTPDPCADQTDQADPCADRVRGVSDEGDVGRGFLLS